MMPQGLQEWFTHPHVDADNVTGRLRSVEGVTPAEDEENGEDELYDEVNEQEDGSSWHTVCWQLNTRRRIMYSYTIQCRCIMHSYTMQCRCIMHSYTIQCRADVSCIHTPYSVEQTYHVFIHHAVLSRRIMYSYAIQCWADISCIHTP